ncbi:MAG: M23 family metallopeptidase [Verrucomicrobiota bacterium]
MKRRDGSQTWVLLGMLVCSAVLVLIVIFQGTPEPMEVEDEPRERRVSMLLAKGTVGEEPSLLDTSFVLMRPVDLVQMPMATRFDFPLGSEHGALTYDAQTFGQNGHLGDDLNGIGGADSDLGDYVFASGEGRVLYAGWASDGWGNLVMLGHRLADGRVVQTVYAHLDRVDVAVGQRVHRGDVIGTVGKGAGQYLAHLHFEVREASTVNPASGYDEKQLDRVPPTQFLYGQRGAGADFLSGAPRFAVVDPYEKMEIRVEVGGETGE